MSSSATGRDEYVYTPGAPKKSKHTKPGFKNLPYFNMFFFSIYILWELE